MTTNDPGSIINSEIVLQDLSVLFPIFASISINLTQSEDSGNFIVLKKRQRGESCDLNFREELSSFDWSLFQSAQNDNEINDSFNNVNDNLYNDTYLLVEVR